MNETNIKHGYSLMVCEARGAILNPGAQISEAGAEFMRVLLKYEMKRNEAKWSEMKRNEDEMKRNEAKWRRNEAKWSRRKRNEAKYSKI